MGRYRAPTKPSSFYITPEGKRRLQDELSFLWRDKRPKVTRSVTEAAAQGDRSENAEYIYGKKQLREIDARVRFLRKRLEQLIVVDRIPDDQETIYFGAKITLEDEDGNEQTYQIVGADEFDLKRNRISVDAPLARALLGKRIGDDITFKGPKGHSEYYVLDVKYG